MICHARAPSQSSGSPLSGNVLRLARSPFGSWDRQAPRKCFFFFFFCVFCFVQLRLVRVRAVKRALPRLLVHRHAVAEVALYPGQRFNKVLGGLFRRGCRMMLELADARVPDLELGGIRPDDLRLSHRDHMANGDMHTSWTCQHNLSKTDFFLDRLLTRSVDQGRANSS